MNDPDKRDYQEWSEMAAEGIEIETMEEYRNEVRGFNDYEDYEDYLCGDYDYDDGYDR